MCYSFAPKYYDKDVDAWLDNPHGNNNRALYIGTEMELLEEVEPIIWAYMADVNSESIVRGTCTPEEEERVKQAIKYLNGVDEDGKLLGGIYLEYLPDFTVSALEAVIQEHSREPHLVTAVFFDYMFPTAELLNEYRQYAGNMGNREDQALNFLSTKLKDMARHNRVSIDTWTQVSGDWKNEQNRDQTIVRGSKGVIDKADLAFIATRPTQSELLKIRPLQEAAVPTLPDPNLCLTVYKNRSGRYNDVKIWLNIDYGSMRVHDLFVTDLDYVGVVGLQKSIAIKKADGTVSITTSGDARDEYYEGRLTEEELTNINAIEKNNQSYVGRVTRKHQEKLDQLAKATVGGSLMGKISDIPEDLEIPTANDDFD